MAVTIHALCPTLTVEIDFTNDPTNGSRVWTDVSSYVRQLSYSRAGRNNELGRTEPGTLSAVLDNRDGRFDPTWSSSPYYPGIKRMRWIRISATWSATTYRRFTGLIEQWSLEWPEAGRDAIATISATDAMKVLNLYQLSGQTYAQQLSSDRVSDILTAAQVPAGTISGGTSTCAAATFGTNSSALDHLLAVEETEGGLLFAEGDGTIVFQDRHFRVTNANSITSRGIVGDDAGSDILMAAGQMNLDDDFVWNAADVTPVGGEAQSATNSASITKYFERRVSRSILSPSRFDALSTAQYLVSRYADPLVRIPTVLLRGMAKTTGWPLILSAKN